MADDLAVRLDRERRAEMSCTAGVGGDVAPLVETATSGRPTVVIDGCPLGCAKQSLAKQDVTPDSHVDLAAEGVSKEYHAGDEDEQAEELFEELLREVERVTASG